MNESVATPYGPVAAAVLARAQAIKLLISDVDGVLSDGLIYMDTQGNELKTFHVHDGHGICHLLAAAFEVALITCRSSHMVSQRAATLGIRHVYQGERDKTIPFNKLLLDLQLQPQQVAYIGDDLVDWPVMSRVGLSVCVADAHPWLLPRVDYVTRKAGGRGAVRELCDLLLFAQNKLNCALGQAL